MTTKQKFLLAVLAGWTAPYALIFLGKGTVAIAVAAAAMAWWHGYVAARLETRVERERSATGPTAVSA